MLLILWVTRRFMGSELVAEGKLFGFSIWVWQSSLLHLQFSELLKGSKVPTDIIVGRAILFPLNISWPKAVISSLLMELMYCPHDKINQVSNLIVFLLEMLETLRNEQWHIMEGRMAFQFQQISRQRPQKKCLQETRYMAFAILGKSKTTFVWGFCCSNIINSTLHHPMIFYLFDITHRKVAETTLVPSRLLSVRGWRTSELFTMMFEKIHWASSVNSNLVPIEWFLTTGNQAWRLFWHDFLN